MLWIENERGEKEYTGGTPVPPRKRDCDKEGEITNLPYYKAIRV
jgi:hypothetical protein